MKRYLTRRNIIMTTVCLVVGLVLLIALLPRGRSVADNQADLVKASDQLDSVWQYVQNGSKQKDNQFYSGVIARVSTARPIVDGANADLAKSKLSKGGQELKLIRGDVTMASGQLGDLQTAAHQHDGARVDTAVSDLSVTLDVYNQHVLDYNDATYDSSGTRIALLYAGSFVAASSLAGGLSAWAFYRGQKNSGDVTVEIKRRLRWQAAYYALATTGMTLILAMLYFFTAIIPSPLFWIFPLGGLGGMFYTFARLHKVRRLSRSTESKAA